MNDIFKVIKYMLTGDRMRVRLMNLYRTAEDIL